MLLLCIAKKTHWVLKNDLNNVTGVSWSVIGSPVYLYRQYFTARAIRLAIVTLYTLSMVASSKP